MSRESAASTFFLKIILIKPKLGTEETSGQVEKPNSAVCNDKGSTFFNLLKYTRLTFFISIPQLELLVINRNCENRKIIISAKNF